MPTPNDSFARLLRRAAAAPPRALTPLSPSREAAVLRAWRAARAQAATPRGLLALFSLDGLLAPALGSATALLAAVMFWTASHHSEAPGPSSRNQTDNLTAEIEELVTEPAALLAYENS